MYMTSKHYNLINTNQLMKFYKCKEWLSLRQEALKRDNYECQRCKKKGKQRQADCVHHIKYVKEFPAFALTLSNLECLCNQCHNEEHERLPNQQEKKIINQERW
ncbi:TPA: HNH endonuclease [Listeria innocua]|nr:HNH endonuclease [Listeria innocua]EEJ1222723.1 HNH endonuclease [Listeria innocua]HBM3758456.1 HNH endonuclease [Listeria innocua]HBM3982996.1 HNH endonuclease [Listeria innocua]